MSRYGYTKGSPIRDHKEPINPETVREQERLQQYLLDREQSRFKDGPTGFKRRKAPKLPFLSRFGGVIGGFLGVGCAFMFFVNPLYQLFLAPITHKILHPKETELFGLDPKEVFEREVALSYKVEHIDEIQEIKNNLGSTALFLTILKKS